VTALALGLLLVPFADLGVKLCLRGALNGGALTLGRVGRLEEVPGRLWLSRVLPARNRNALMWSLWLIAAISLSAAAIRIGAGGGFAGLLLGGSLAHLLESTVRGWITDFVCLRFWPAFDLADAAIVVGAIGLLVTAARAGMLVV
jgi:signal peptidase II